MTTYTNINKPVSTTYTKTNKDLVNYPEYGAAVYGQSKYGRGSPYTAVNKPATTTYTNITKPT